MTPGFGAVASGGGHKDATFHVGGHGQPWPDIKVMAITSGGQTWVCVRRDGAETVTSAGSIREGAGDVRGSAPAGHLGTACLRIGRWFS